MKTTKVKTAYMKKKDPLFVRESLLNAAFELAATKGMADVTVNKVSELANVTKGALFNHFDSKETLVTELMQMRLTRLGYWNCSIPDILQNSSSICCIPPLLDGWSGLNTSRVPSIAVNTRRSFGI